MNNEPVAWMYKDEESGMVSFIKDTLPFDAVPLYTHPVKELTDDDIWEFIPMSRNDNFVEAGAGDFIEFARAILRKANEK